MDMSRSPKYSQARLQEERRRELVRERQRLAAIEAQQRREREEEERRRRTQQATERAARMKAEKDARDTLNELHVQLVGLKSDNVVGAWCQSEVAAVESMIGELEKLIVSEEWDPVAGKASQIKNNFASILAKAQDRQLKEEIRNYIQKGMGNTLAAMGFQVGVPYLMEPGNYNSDVVIRARRPDGRSLRVEVPIDGNVSYRVDGYPMRRVSGQGGTGYATCDEAQTVIESFHRRIHQQFGIEMGELRWEDKPPVRLSRDHKELPNRGGDIYQKSGG
jgi:hypothetical protein